MSELDALYNDLIMEQSNSKHNRKVLEDADQKEHGHNPNCGDDIDLYIKYDGDIIVDMSFTGSGCAISQASTSMMIDLLKGKSKAQALEEIELFLAMIKREELTEEQLEQLEDAAALENISNMPARVKCAVLAWHTLHGVIEE